MGLGAYSVVRYADDLSDQRINLGVVVWHPVDGYRCRLSPAVDRVQAIDPRITVKPLKRQLDDIKESVHAAPPTEKGLLNALCMNFKHGLVISCPYPAKISSADETLERLYDLLVSPVPEIRRASSQRAFEASLKRTIEVFLSEWPKSRCQNIGVKNIKGVPVNVGIRSQLIHTGPGALWHPLSLQSEARAEVQLTSAKSTVLDIIKSREIDQFKRDKQYVAVLAPRAKAASSLDDVVSCLKHAADEVYVGNDNVVLAASVQRGLSALASSESRRRTHS
jgi:hypothetical protein